MSNNSERFVLVTTEYRGVFAGWASDTSGETIKLRAAQLCVYWHANVKGFMGLASAGPTAECRIGRPADIELRKVTSVTEIAKGAQARWEAMPWT